jgi:hypothetical protein
MLHIRELIRKALTVVLQHWMILDLGWNLDMLRSPLPHLQQTIVEKRIKYPTYNKRCGDRERFVHSFSGHGFFMDKEWLQWLNSKIANIEPLYFKANFTKVSVAAEML